MVRVDRELFTETFAGKEKINTGVSCNMAKCNLGKLKCKASLLASSLQSESGVARDFVQKHLHLTAWL